MKHLKVWVMIALIMLIQCVIIYQISAYMQKILNIFPHQDCEALFSKHGSNLESYAVWDYDRLNEGGFKQSSGHLQCFC